MVCIVTPSYYSRDENFDEADLVVSSLGEPGAEVAKVIRSKVTLPELNFVNLEVIKRLFI